MAAAGGLDKHQIRKLAQAGAPVDGFGGGAELVVSSARQR
jgi:nicotinic acid phosphoribosyltransferase